MALSPSSHAPQAAPEVVNRVSSNDLQKNVQNESSKSSSGQALYSIPRTNLERPASAGSNVPLPGTYYLKANDARGKHMIQYVYANLRDPNDLSLPLHVREKYKEIEKERSRGFQPPGGCRGVSPNRQHSGGSQNNSAIKPTRPASANCERRVAHSQGTALHAQYHLKPNKPDAEISRGLTTVKANQKANTTQIQQTRSSNAVTSPKRGSRSRSKTASPRRRRPFSIAADSSDTDPIENQRSVESIARSPPRMARGRNVRRQQYLATKFKLAAKNSKHTQTFVAASGLSVEESSGSATTVISRHHSTTQTDALGKKAAETTSSQPDCQTSTSSAPHASDPVSEDQPAVDADKPPISPQSAVKPEQKTAVPVQKTPENMEWKKAKVRLRSTPGSPSPPPPESRHRVRSADRVRSVPIEKPSCLTGARATSGQNALTTQHSSAGRLGSPVSEKRFASSATQIDENPTKSTGVQVKIKKRSSSHHHSRNQRRSPSQKSINSKMSLPDDTKPKDEKKRTKKKKKKVRKSREPSVRSLRSLHSYPSDVSTGILKHVKLMPASPAASRSGSRRAASAAAMVKTKKKKSKKKKKTKQTSSKIARFLRQLSRDKEAIQVINKMASAHKKKASK